MNLMVMFDAKQVERKNNDILSMLSKSEHEDFEERSAIMEYDAGLSQAEAEKRALEITLQRRHDYELAQVLAEAYHG